MNNIKIRILNSWSNSKLDDKDFKIGTNYIFLNHSNTIDNKQSSTSAASNSKKQKT